MSINTTAKLLMIAAILMIVSDIYSAIYFISNFVSDYTSGGEIFAQVLRALPGVGLLIFAVALQNNSAENYLHDDEIIATTDTLPLTNISTDEN